MRELIIRAIVLSIGLLGTAAMLIDWNTIRWHATEQWTDDAQLRGDPTRLEARVTGYVTRVAVDDYAKVRAGQNLFEIETAEYAAQLQQARANLEAARARMGQSQAQAALQQARIDSAEASKAVTAATLERAEQEERRQTGLLNTPGGLRRSWEQATADRARYSATLDGNRAQVEAARAEKAADVAQLRQAQAGLQAQQSATSLAEINLGWTAVTAPRDGAVSERLVRLGQYVTPGTPLITFVPADDVWVVAYYREEQMDRVRVGQRVAITVDMLPDVTLWGHVDGIEPVTQQRTAVLPATRGTGSFTKIVQRVPVRIVFEPGTSMRRLLPGLTVETRVDTSDARG